VSHDALQQNVEPSDDLWCWNDATLKDGSQITTLHENKYRKQMITDENDKNIARTCENTREHVILKVATSAIVSNLLSGQGRFFSRAVLDRNLMEKALNIASLPPQDAWCLQRSYGFR